MSPVSTAALSILVAMVDMSYFRLNPAQSHAIGARSHTPWRFRSITIY